MLRMRANGETFVSTGKSHSRLLIRKVAFSGNLVFIEICLRSLCMDELNLVDILRIKNSSKRCFTYESSALKMKSRIDFFLISKSPISSTKTADIKTAIAPDHKAIRLFLQFENKKKDPGLWKFNNSLLNDDTFVNLITTNYPIICRKYAHLTNLKLKCEMIKMEIRSLTIPYAKNKAKKIRTLEKQLESRIESLENNIDPNPDDGTGAEQQEYERLMSYLRRGQTVLSINMELRNYNKKTITELIVAGGTTPPMMMMILADFMLETFSKVV